MKIYSSKKIKAFIVGVSEIEKLGEYFKEKISDPFLGLPYRRLPEYEIVQGNGFNYKYDTMEAFIECIGLNIQNVKEIKMSFRGDNESLSFTLGRDTASFSLDGDNEGKLLEYSSYIEKNLKEKSLNDILHQTWFVIPIQFFATSFIISISFLLKKYINGFNFFIVYWIALMSSLPIGVIVSGLLPKYYPVVVLRHNNKYYRRILTMDLWKIISFVILSILLPFGINLLSD